jgi:hypothetical protein
LIYPARVALPVASLPGKDAFVKVEILQRGCNKVKRKITPSINNVVLDIT